MGEGVTTGGRGGYGVGVSEGAPKSAESAPPPRRPGEIPAEVPILLANGETCAAIAERFGVGKATAIRWKDDPGTRERIEEIHAELRRAAVARGKALLRKAVAVVEEVLADDEQPGPVRLKAAEIVFDRWGLPKRVETEVSGSLAVAVASVPDADLDAAEAEAMAEELARRGYSVQAPER